MADEIRLRLLEESGDDRKAGSDLSCVLRREWKRVLPDIDAARRERPLPRRLIALVEKDRDVERRVVRPRLQHAMIEVEPVHLRADDVVVDLLRNRPGARIDRGQPIHVAGEITTLRRHRRCRVVRHAVHALRLLECSPVSEEREHVLVARAPRGSGRGRRRWRWRRAAADDQERQETKHAGQPHERTIPGWVGGV